MPSVPTLDAPARRTRIYGAPVELVAPPSQPSAETTQVGPLRGRTLPFVPVIVPASPASSAAATVSSVTPSSSPVSPARSPRVLPPLAVASMLLISSALLLASLGLAIEAML